MDLAELLSRVAAELALFAGAGFLLFAVNDLIVDIIYFARAIWRSLVRSASMSSGTAAVNHQTLLRLHAIAGSPPALTSRS